MKRTRLSLPVLLCLVLCVSPLPARALEPASEAPHEGYLVKLNSQAGVWALSGGSGSPGQLLAVDTLEEALSIPEELVEYVEPNYLVELFAASPGGTAAEAPNDPYYAAYQWSLQEIHAYEANRRGLTGAGVLVGFVDSGVNRAHEDLLAGNISGMNFNRDGHPFDQDDYGHGTFAAGIVAAQTGNGLGLTGIAPDVTLRAYRVFDQRTTTVNFVAAAIEQAVSDGCQILNLSLGLSYDSTPLREAVGKAVDAGVVVTAAVGNNGTSVLQYPAAYPGVIGVGSVDSGLTVSSFSQRNESVDFTAPGGGVAGLGNLATDAYRLTLASPANQGTSYATPVISALAALILGYDPSVSPAGVFALLQASALDLGDPGYDTSYGYGVVDAELLARELERRYPITYHPGADAALPADAPASYRMYAGESLPVPVRPGYWFTGWYPDEDCAGARLYRLPVGTTGDLTLYAGWIPQDRAPRICCLADYDSQGKLVSLEYLAPEAWDHPEPPQEPGRRYQVFWMDGSFRPTLAATPSKEPENRGTFP